MQPTVARPVLAPPPTRPDLTDLVPVHPGRSIIVPPKAPPHVPYPFAALFDQSSLILVSQDPLAAVQAPPLADDDDDDVELLDRKREAALTWSNYKSMEALMGLPTQWDPRPTWRLWKLDIHVAVKGNVRPPLRAGCHWERTYWCRNLEQVERYYLEWREWRKENHGSQGDFNHVKMIISSWIWDVGGGSERGTESNLI